MQLGNTLQAQSMPTQPSLQSWALLICWRTLAWPGKGKYTGVFLSILSFTALGQELTAQTTMTMTMSAYVYRVLAACLALLPAPGMDYVIKSSQQPCLQGILLLTPLDR